MHLGPFDELAKKLFAALPTGMQNLEQDLEKQFKDILQSAFAKLDLITRDEFDAQTKVLARTREKLELLEQQVTQLLSARRPEQSERPPE